MNLMTRLPRPRRTNGGSMLRMQTQNRSFKSKTISLASLHQHLSLPSTSMQRPMTKKPHSFKRPSSRSPLPQSYTTSPIQNILKKFPARCRSHWNKYGRRLAKYHQIKRQDQTGSAIDFSKTRSPLLKNTFTH